MSRQRQKELSFLSAYSREDSISLHHPINGPEGISRVLKRLKISLVDKFRRNGVDLREFGYQLLHTEENRDEVIISYKENVAVIEIKGQKGSAAEANAAQLMKWVATYHHDNEKLPKGIPYHQCIQR